MLLPTEMTFMSGVPLPKSTTPLPVWKSALQNLGHTKPLNNSGFLTVGGHQHGCNWLLPITAVSPRPCSGAVVDLLMGI